MDKSPTDEIRAIRHELAARFDNDVDRIFEDLERQQHESNRKFLRMPKRDPIVGMSIFEPPTVQDSNQPQS